VALGNDARVRVGRKGAIDVELYGSLLDRLYKVVLSRPWDKDIIWSHANLRKRSVSVGEHCGAPVMAGACYCGAFELTWPAFTVLPQRTRFAAILRFVVLGSMTTGDFPPSSRVTGVRCSAAAFATMRAITAFPVYMTDDKQRPQMMSIGCRYVSILRTVIPL
jgi:hypothetical protein